MPKQKRTAQQATAANVGCEAELWQMADARRGSMDAAEYKHVVLGLIFLKYVAAPRDTLLPRLISGELRVKDAERFISEGVA